MTSNEYFRILSVMVTSSKKDAKNRNRIVVKSVVSAQNILTNPGVEFIRKELFGEKISNLCNVFDDDLISFWKVRDMEASNTEKSCSQLTHLITKQYDPKDDAVVGIFILLLPFVLGIFVFAALIIRYKRQKSYETEIIQESLDPILKRDVRDFMNKDGVSFAPYVDVRLESRNKKRKEEIKVTREWQEMKLTSRLMTPAFI